MALTPRTPAALAAPADRPRVQPPPPAPPLFPGGTGPGRRPAAPGLTVIYDERCAFCRRCRQWLADQPAHVPLRFLAAGSVAARERYGSARWLGQELAVVDDVGRAWIGADAFVVSLWATRPYRALALTLRNPVLRPLARTFFAELSRRRHRPEPGPVGHDHCPGGGCHTGDHATLQPPGRQRRW